MTEHEKPLYQRTHLLVEKVNAGEFRLTLKEGDEPLMGPVKATREQYRRMVDICISRSSPRMEQLSLSEGNGQSSYGIAIDLSSFNCVRDWLRELMRLRGSR